MKPHLPPSNLLQRVITGVVGGGVMIASILYGEASFFVLFLVICFFATREFYDLVIQDGFKPQEYFGIFCSLFVFTFSFLTGKGLLPPRFLLLIIPVCFGVFLIKLYRREEKPFSNIAFTFLGIIYVAIPLSLLNLLVFKGGSYNYEILFGSLLIIWITDISAYFGGSRFGRNKLFERISPKKTWEGFFTGTAMGLIMAYLISRYFVILPVRDWMILGVILTVIGTFGDLIESQFKRSIDIKDSGSILPGHGGFLDRFDSLLIAIPFVVAYLELLSAFA